MGDVSLEVLDAKLDAVLMRVGDVCDRQDDQEKRLRKVENETTRHGERLSLVAGGLAVLQLIGSAIAAVVGVLVRP